MTSIFENKTVLITGGTGFLGRALLRHILERGPHSVRLFSRDEVKHHGVSQQFDSNQVRYLIGDVRDMARIRKAMQGVDIVIHAAALKRIDMIEYNVTESIKTNVIGTMNVVQAALDEHVEKAVFVSTDKACAPVNTYGACKFVGERIFTESNFNKGSARTVFCSVRYGNVLNSTGSVIPFFEKRLREGESLPITDPRMTRFIITQDEAVELIVDALQLSIGGEVFVPKLPAFEIIDLVAVLKQKHNADVETTVVGIRPGEKLHELMLSTADIRRTYEFDNRYVVTSAIEMYQALDRRPTYIEHGRKLTEEDMVEYSSKDHVLSAVQLASFLRARGII